MDEKTQQVVKDNAQLEELRDFYRKFGNEEKGIDAFFLEIIQTTNSEKIGNLTEEELGMPRLSVRTLIELSDDCSLIPSMSTFSEKFKKQAENILATSLSKEGFLIKSRITQKKEFADQKKKKKRKGLFGRKEEDDD